MKSPAPSVEKDEVKPVFLRQADLFLPERPAREGYILMDSMWSGFTKLKGFQGFETEQGKAGEYVYQASAGIYTAEVLRFDRKIYAGEDTRTPHEEHVFWGSFALYRQEFPVFKTSFDGTVLQCTGTLWGGIPHTQKKASLKEFLFDGASSDSERTRRLHAIFQGYQAQEDARQENQSRAIHDSYERGQGDYREAAFGTFGRAPL